MLKVGGRMGNFTSESKSESTQANHSTVQENRRQRNSDFKLSMVRHTVIPALWEAQEGWSQVWAQTGQLSKTLFQKFKTIKIKKAGDVAQYKGLGLNAQYHHTLPHKN